MKEALFNLDNPVFRFLSRLVDLAYLNILFVVTSIPLVTIGAAWTSLQYVCVSDWDPQNGHLTKKYMKSFKENLKQSTILWLIMLVAGVIIGLSVWMSFVQWRETDSNMLLGGTVAMLFVALAYICVFLYVWPLQAKFTNTVVNTILNAFVMAVTHIPETIVAVCIMGIVAYAMYISVFARVTFWMWPFAVTAYLQGVLFRRVFAPHLGIPEEDEVWSEETKTQRENRYAEAKLEVAELKKEIEEETLEAERMDTEENRMEEAVLEAEEGQGIEPEKE